MVTENIYKKWISSIESYEYSAVHNETSKTMIPTNFHLYVVNSFEVIAWALNCVKDPTHWDDKITV